MRPSRLHRPERPREPADLYGQQPDDVHSASPTARADEHGQTRRGPARSPSHTGRPGRRAPAHSQSSKVIHNGRVAMPSAATPDGTRCCAHASRPWQPRNSRTPTIAAARQCRERRPFVGAKARPQIEAEPGQQRPHAHQQERRDRLDRVANGEEVRTPDEVDEEEGAQHLRLPGIEPSSLLQAGGQIDRRTHRRTASPSIALWHK